MSRRLVPLIALLALASGCNSMNSAFYAPDREPEWTTAEVLTGAEDVRFESRDGTSLHGWFLPAVGQPLGTVLFFHGNAGNVSTQVRKVAWLPFEGYQVFLFDYRGYGLSEGVPERAGIQLDGLAALDCVSARADVDPRRLLVLGHSLGGAVALASVGEAKQHGVQGIAVQGTFGDYQDVANTMVGGTLLTLPVSCLLVSNDHSPAHSVERLAGVPKFVIHGDEDPTIAFSLGEELFEALPEPKQFLHVRKGGHFLIRHRSVREQIVAFFAQCLAAPVPEALRISAEDSERLSEFELPPRVRRALEAARAVLEAAQVEEPAQPTEPAGTQ